MTMQQFFDAFSFSLDNAPTNLFEFILGAIIEIVYIIVHSPLLLFTTGFLFVGGCIGIFGRLLSRN